MRTTIDLPEDLHRIARAIARDTSRTLSETVAELMRRGLQREQTIEIGTSRKSGFPTISVGRVVTSDDVASLDDE